MKTFSYIYIILLPYLILFSAILILGKIISEFNFIMFILAVIVICSIGVVSCIICNIMSLAKISDKKSASRNIVIKVCHIPAHIILLLIFGGMMNPFLFMASWIPIALSVSLTAFSGFTNIGACVNLFRNGKCKLSSAIVLCLLSFVCILDFVAGMVQYAKSKKQV